MFWARFVSGVILAPLFLVIVYLGFPYFHLMIAAIAGLMAWEFSRMDGQAGRKRRWLMSGAAVLAVAAVAAGSMVAALAITLAAVVAVIVADQVAGRSGLHVVQMAVPYVALPAISLLFVRTVGGSESLFWVLAVVWATDIGAYAFGRLIGGPKLAPAISPNKTWSGALGGLACAILASAAVFWGYQHAISLGLALVAGLLSIISQAGDLFESALKRRYQVKDSGALIPGHGGVMDRFDGLWAAAPVAAFFCVILDGGVQHW